MEITHISGGIVTVHSEAVHTRVHRIYRFTTIISYWPPLNFTIYDKWTNKSFDFSFQLEDVYLNIYSQIEKIVSQEPEYHILKEANQFEKNTEFSDQLIEDLFNGWIYNAKLFGNKIEGNKEHQHESNKKFYYDRFTNKVVFISSVQLKPHTHYPFLLEHQGNNKLTIIKNLFGVELLENQKFKNRFFDFEYYKEINIFALSIKNGGEKMSQFRRLIGNNWLQYINSEYIIPPSDIDGIS